MGEPRVIVATGDLFFRAKLEAVVRTAGGEPCREPPAPVAVVELTDDRALARVGELVRAGTAVLAFGAHVHAARLRAARAAGARAVPNAEVEVALRELLGGSTV